MKRSDIVWLVAVAVIIAGGLTATVVLLNGAREDEAQTNAQTLHEEQVANAVLLHHEQVRASKESRTNQIHSCEGGQVIRRIALGLSRSAAESRRVSESESTTEAGRAKNKELVNRFAGYAHELLTAPFTNSDGTRQCRKAIPPPPPIPLRLPSLGGPGGG